MDAWNIGRNGKITVANIVIWALNDFRGYDRKEKGYNLGYDLKKKSLIQKFFFHTQFV